MDIKKVIFDNTSWILSKNIIGHITKLGTKLILARLLLPEDFGTVALVITILNLISLIGTLGSHAFVIYNKTHPEKETASNAFFINFTLNLLLFLLLFLSASILANFFNNQNLSILLKIFGFFILLSPIYNISFSLLEKRIDFKHISIAELSGLISYAFLAVLFSYYQKSYWALLFAHFISTTINTVMLAFFSKISVSIKHLNFKIIKDIIKFGKYIIGQAFVVQSKHQYDNIIIAKFLSTQALGFYTWAFTIATLPIISFVHAVNSVVYPIYCKLQHNKEEILNILYNTANIVLIFLLPLMIVIGCFTNNIILFLLGEKWLPLCPILKVLCIYSTLRSIIAIVSPIFNAIGKPKIIFYTNTISLLIGFGLIPIFVYYFGSIGAAYAITLGFFVDFAMISFYLLKEFPQAKQYNKSLWDIITVNIFLLLYFLICNTIMTKPLAFFTGIIAYSITIIKIKKELLEKLYHLFKYKVMNLKRKLSF